MLISPHALHPWKTRHSRAKAGDSPLRAELFSTEQQARHARSLAESHRLSGRRCSNRLLERLDGNEKILRAFNRSTRAADPARRITPAAEWLLDNHYLIEEQIQMARQHLPRGYSRELPRLANGKCAGLPRVYDIVVELVTHADAQIDSGELVAFIAAYQSVTPLKLGELWAIPIMLRLSLIENLQRITTRLVRAREDRNLADKWARQLQEMAEKNPSQLVVVVADMAKSNPPMSSAFVTEFCQQLSHHSPEIHLLRGWLQHRLIEHGTSIERLIDVENQNQAADQVSVSHSIASLRFLSATNWKEFVESLSMVEEILQRDPAGCYAKMDFTTRDRYRHVVEGLSRHGDLTEIEVARLAIEQAGTAAAGAGTLHRSAHVGYYLIDDGAAVMGRMAKVKWPWRSGLERFILRCPLEFHVGMILTLTLLATTGFMWHVRIAGAGEWVAVMLSLAFLVCASQLAVSLMNWLATSLVSPRLLPRMDFSSGIAPDSRTMVVVPTMLSDTDGVDRLLETLEIHYLANRDEHLHFGLLTDFRDAATENLTGDEALVRQAGMGVEALNLKYPSGAMDRFYLFHRPRRWNQTDGLWMGYERKRGKLTEFNALLRGEAEDCFSTIVGDTTVFPLIRHVITLDTDTQLPRDAARLLAATMAHPLNHPVFDDTRGIVTGGYGILQPRVEVSLPSARRSWFVRIFAGDTGIDPYTRAVSDVYQDLFGEGSFIGKGIYDVDAFQRAMAGKFRENTILSHDLLESCHARSALVSDVQFYEDYPPRYLADVDRRHRWMRGDWQIARWLLTRVPGADSRIIDNPLTSLSKWKIFDNLRRSLIPAAMMGFIMGAWLFAPQHATLYTWLAIGMVALPGLLGAGVRFCLKPSSLPWNMHLREVTESFGRMIVQNALVITFLPYEVFISLDAICRTSIRLLITRKRLLEWKTSDDCDRTRHDDASNFLATMWVGPAIAVLCGILLAVTNQQFLLVMLPILAAWFVSPWIACWISRPIETEQHDLHADQLAFLRITARKTWHFFETFVTSGENWLPPDNYQENPLPVVATRTSPTNMGLALLANLTAWDFGYISANDLMCRTRDALATMRRLDRHHGHFYNWYDTRTLAALPPLYVSSVDSGNLAGHLLTLGSGLREQQHAPMLRPAVFTGLCDTMGVLGMLVRGNSHLTAIGAELATAPSGLLATRRVLENAKALIDILAGSLENESEEITRWVRALKDQCDDQLQDLLFLAPWLELPHVNAGSRMDVNLRSLDQGPSLHEVAGYAKTLCPTIDGTVRNSDMSAAPEHPDEIAYLTALSGCLKNAAGQASQRIATLETLADQCDALAAMDFTCLFEPTRDLFSIGLNVTERRLDRSYYDLLASEARLCSYVAIALGQIPQDHWFSLGRLLVSSHGHPILASWSGSMFEYLMPLLVMPTYENTLLDHTYKAAVRQQIKYGKLRGTPWGISESGYYRIDVMFNYQYRAFGVPGLGLKRGLGDDLVIAPYASTMALLVDPRAACENLQRLASEERFGAYGFFEAVDYTASRMPPDKTSVTIRSFMVHHQGMSLLALSGLLNDQPMQRRFMGCPLLKAADLLLQERVPKTAASVVSSDLALELGKKTETDGECVMRVFSKPTTPVPEVHLLSNGRYHVVVSSAGSGYSRWHDMAITRWREDATRDHWGTFVYVRDVASGEFFSNAHQPTLLATEEYEAVFSQARAEFRQHHAGLKVHTEICVSPEDDVELRRVTLTNRMAVERIIELTSYAEVVLATPAEDAAHPAFSNLFVQTEFLPSSSAIVCTRRARSATETPPWLVHLMIGNGTDAGEASCETDRAKFVGRGRSLGNPAAMQRGTSLSNTVGAVLDPIVSLRRWITLPPFGTATIDLVFGVNPNRKDALSCVEKYQNPRMVDRAFDLAWTHSQVTLHHLNATETDAQLFDRLAGPLIYADSARRANSGILFNNRRGQNGLWSHGISGDFPILLLHIRDMANIEIVRQLIRAHSYWRMKGLIVDLVILYEEVSTYHQSLLQEISGLASTGFEAQLLDKPGGIFVRRLEQIPNEDRVLIQSVARVVLDDERGTLAEQLERRIFSGSRVPPLIPSRQATADVSSPLSPRELIHTNGYGGFTRDGHEYVITLNDDGMTPAPWVNVLANANFGTLVSESGSAYTWSENAHEFRITPWSNDPVIDPTGEAIYIRDEQTGRFWSPTPAPARGRTPYVIRHGFGYSVFEHTENGIYSELWVYVAMDASVKFSVLKLRNVSGGNRQLSVTSYVEWVLGDLRQKNLLHVQTEVDAKTGALLARNHGNTEFPGRIVFLDVNDITRTFTGDRKEFIGRNGELSRPAAMKRAGLSGKVGAGLDPCGAVQVVFDLPAGQERETVFRLGVTGSQADMRNLVTRFRRADACRGALEGVWSYWSRTLCAVNVETPDAAVNVMANGWLLYQTLGCRVWGRTGFYQSGGAYGFRDQLQDVLALVHAEPGITRGHLLRAASRQFREGDAQHWWHPPSGRGVRTHSSDDYLWLPYATSRYVECVADTGVLDEPVSFLDARQVKPGEEAYYDLPNRAEESATLYQHCVRAIDRALRFGSHGLPLMGGGDWNDGMNLVGKDGRGESVWLAFFLYDVLGRFAKIAATRGDSVFSQRCLEQASQLQENIELHAWDGQWYRRAYFDNGEVLGSQSNLECRIDSLPQSWSVISGAGDTDRAHMAMASVYQRLVRHDAGLIQLFDPPFDKSTLDPGYIKGYTPGVRENGGQYTHAAIWTAMAFAEMGDNERAWELFNLLNPVHHGDSPDKISIYKVEPYVVAADVYAVAPHTGRGGWTWYTGSASWMYRLLIETLLGVHLEGDRLRLTPKMPGHWPGYTIHYRFRQTVYHIAIRRMAADSGEQSRVILDGRNVSENWIPLQDDHQEHFVEMTV